jgi:hypothetical protein
VGIFRDIRHLTGGGFESVGPGHVEKRQAVRSGIIGEATLACRRCDAPIAPGPDPLSLTDQLWCPVCHDAGPVRDFLSLAVPTRPARVVVRVAMRVSAS